MAVRTHRDEQSQAHGLWLRVQQNVGQGRDVRLCLVSANGSGARRVLAVADVNDDGEVLTRPRAAAQVDVLVISGDCVAKSPRSGSCVWRMSLVERVRRMTSLLTVRALDSFSTSGD
jgi:hypothetical protein